MIPARTLLAVASTLALLAAPVSAGPPDWNAVADVGTVQVVTTDEDGSPRDTKVWLVVVDGEGYIRTGGTRWGGNVVRDPDVTLRIEGSEHALRVEFVEDDEQRQRIVEAFREKYGFTDRALSIFRGGHPKIMRLLPRD